jgi:hypothetical protein
MCGVTESGYRSKSTSKAVALLPLLASGGVEVRGLSGASDSGGRGSWRLVVGRSFLFFLWIFLYLFLLCTVHWEPRAEKAVSVVGVGKRLGWKTRRGRQSL